MNHPFVIPNEDRNVKLLEKKRGLLMIYTLPCPKDFPDISFISRRGVGYYCLGLPIYYQDNMSQAINRAYWKLKYKVMLDLAYFKRRKLDRKIQHLEYKQSKLF